MSLTCDHCEENIACEIEDFGDEVMRICQACEDTLEFDEYSRQRVPEIVATVNGLRIGAETLRNDTLECEWSSEITLRTHATVLRDYDGCTRGYVHPSQDIDHCYGDDCSYVGSPDDFMYHEDTEVSYCEHCYPKDEGDRWHRRITKQDCDSFAKFPIDNYVGIEFETEMSDSYRSLYDYDVRKYIAEAKHDGSLDYGTEYVSHPLQGDDILECVEDMCQALSENNFSLRETCGWHFHYDVSRMGNARQKKVWKAFAEFSDLMKDIQHIQELPDYGYFRRMFREYSENWTDRYRDWGSQWALDSGRRKYSSRHWERQYSGSSPYRKYTWVNFEPLRMGFERIEVRMYHPDTFRQSCTDSLGWSGEAFEKVSDDYPKFIRFWHEFIRKAGYGKNGVKVYDTGGTGLGIVEFAQQFSTPVKSWLLQRNEDFKEYDTTYKRAKRRIESELDAMEDERIQEVIEEEDTLDYGQALGSSWSPSRED